MKNISILGATGSVGTQTLDVLRSQKDKFNLVGVSANDNYEGVINIIKEFKPACAALMNEAACKIVKNYCMVNNIKTEVLHGSEGLDTIAALPESDIAVISVTGIAGLMPTIKGIRAGKSIALANKETLVAAGSIVMQEAKDNNVRIIPVDSEHSAIFQCIQGSSSNKIHKILLTASGGPFRGKKINELKNVSVEAALNHPNWKMGRKISIDSATLMNKGFEVIEAHHLFNVDYDNVQVIIHPQSIIHSMIEYTDGSVVAQLGSTDMKLPIQYALNYPERENAIVKRLNFYEIGSLTFEKPDTETFKPLKLAYEAGKMGGYYPAILNAANEEAVSLFLHRKISFLKIYDILSDCLNKYEAEHFGKFTLDGVMKIDRTVKAYIRNEYNFGEE